MRRVLTILLMALAAAALAPEASAKRIADFDPAAGEFPEGIAVDARGRLFVSLAPLGEIRQRARDGSWTTYAKIDPGTMGLGVLGLAADRQGTLYAAAPTSAPDWHGVVEIPHHGAPRRLAGTDKIAFPNAVTLDRRRNLYVTDSISGTVWRKTPGAPAAPWVQDAALEGTGALGNGFPIGANGIAHTRGALYVANTEKRLLIRIPIRRSGAAGRPEVVRTFTGEGEFLDGVTADAAGRLYVAVAGTNQIGRLDRRGRWTVVADARDGLSLPVSMAFGIRGRDRRTLYIASFSVPPLVEQPDPGVDAVRVKVPGPRLPLGPRRRCA
jgi:sugar lactone lactonase YvrE